MMDCCGSAEDRWQKKVNKEIEKAIREKAKEKKKEMKLLLLGKCVYIEICSL